MVTSLLYWLLFGVLESEAAAHMPFLQVPMLSVADNISQWSSKRLSVRLLLYMYVIDKACL